MRRLAWLSLLVLGCGRVNFESIAGNGDAGGAGDDAGPVPTLMEACDPPTDSADFFVAPTGSDSGAGSAGDPWATISHAVAEATPGSTVEVAPGVYAETVLITRVASETITVRAAVSYASRIVGDTPIACFDGCANFSFEGFEITKEPGNTGPLVHVSSDGNQLAVRNSVLHTTPVQPLLRVSGGGSRVIFEHNLLYNHGGGAGAVHLAESTDVTIRSNLIFYDYAASPIAPEGDSAGFIWVEGPSSSGHRIEGNVMAGWIGDTTFGAPVRIDDAEDITLVNNLILGTTNELALAAIYVGDSSSVTIAHNTVVGTITGEAFALYLDGSTAPLEDVAVHNNIFSAPAGNMEDLSDGESADVVTLTHSHNLYWNDGTPIPSNDTDVFTVVSETGAVVADPEISLATIDSPLLLSDQTFSGGYTTVCEVIVAAAAAGRISGDSPAIGAAVDSAEPPTDLLGRSRGDAAVGAFAAP